MAGRVRSVTAALGSQPRKTWLWLTGRYRESLTAALGREATVLKAGRPATKVANHARIQEMAVNSRVDAYIVSTEDGFSPLGANCAFLSRDLGIPEADIRRLARWNRFKNPLVSLIALQSRRQGSLLKGVILAAAGSSICYERFVVHRYGRPYRDFYYNVTYESIAHVCEKWGARKLAISHLSGSGAFHEDIATCNAEALAQYCDSTPVANIESFMFLGCCISVEHFCGIPRLNLEGTTGRHRPIIAELQHQEGFDLINLDWASTAADTNLEKNLPFA